MNCLHASWKTFSIEKIYRKMMCTYFFDLLLEWKIPTRTSFVNGYWHRQNNRLIRYHNFVFENYWSIIKVFLCFMNLDSLCVSTLISELWNINLQIYEENLVKYAKHRTPIFRQICGLMDAAGLNPRFKLWWSGNCKNVHLCLLLLWVRTLKELRRCCEHPSSGSQRF